MKTTELLCQRHKEQALTSTYLLKLKIKNSVQLPANLFQLLTFHRKFSYPVKFEKIPDSFHRF